MFEIVMGIDYFLIQLVKYCSSEKTAWNLYYNFWQVFTLLWE